MRMAVQKCPFSATNGNKFDRDDLHLLTPSRDNGGYS
jgi:hypothetical protein